MMRRLSAFAVAGVIGLSGFSSSAAVRPPKLQYELSALPNGLTLVLSEDHSTPIVHLQLWYHVGSKNESPGRTGFAHLFEHLMFKGSRNVEPEGHTSYISSVGGQANAYTEDDVTVFWETVPAQYLPLALWLEADRMASLRITKETFSNQRDARARRRLRRGAGEGAGQRVSRPCAEGGQGGAPRHPEGAAADEGKARD